MIKLVTMIIGLFFGSLLYRFSFRLVYPDGTKRYQYPELKRLTNQWFASCSTSLVFLILVYCYGTSIQTIQYVFMVTILLLCVFTDLFEKIVFDVFIIVGVIIRIFFALLLHESILAVFLNGLSVSFPVYIVVKICEKFSKSEMMGSGDLKLLFMLGMYFNVATNITAMVFSCIFGLLFGVIYEKMAHKDHQFPFVPSIAMGTLVAMLWGNQIVQWYLSFL